MSHARRFAPWPNTDPLLLGTYAWLLTDATPSFRLGVPGVSRVFCVLALVFLVLGWLALVKLPRAADYLMFGGFCGASVLTLISLGHGNVVFGLTVVKLVLGAIIWCLFGISWIRACQLEFSKVDATSLPTANIGGIVQHESRVPALVIQVASLAGAVALTWYGVPSGDGRGILVAGLIVVAALKITSAAGAWAWRIERHRFSRVSRPRHSRS